MGIKHKGKEILIDDKGNDFFKQVLT